MFTKATVPSTVLGACDKTKKVPCHYATCTMMREVVKKILKIRKKFQNKIKSSGLYETKK